MQSAEIDMLSDFFKMDSSNSKMPSSPFFFSSMKSSPTKAIVGEQISILQNKKHPEEVKKEEDIYKRAILDIHKFEDPIQLWLDYLFWVDMNFSDDEEKIFNTLEDFIKFFVEDANFKQEKRYICKWILYATKCRDPEEVLLYMEENKIGTEHSMLYEGLANIYEQEGNYEKAEIFLQNGLTGRAKPTETMILLMKEFENRMKERLENDFYSKGWTLTEEKTKMTVPQRSGKRLCPISENSLYDHPFENKKFKPNEKKLSCVQIGNISIYVDEEYRQYISKSKELVREYNNLCLKYHVQRGAPLTDSKKPLSWISKEVKKYKTHFRNKNTQKSLIKNEFEKNFEIYSEALIKTEGFLIGNKEKRTSTDTKVLNDIKNQNVKINNESCNKLSMGKNNNSEWENNNEERNLRQRASCFLSQGGGLLNFSNRDQGPNLKLPANIFEKNDFSFFKKLKEDSNKPQGVMNETKNGYKPKQPPAKNLFIDPEQAVNKHNQETSKPKKDSNKPKQETNKPKQAILENNLNPSKIYLYDSSSHKDQSSSSFSSLVKNIEGKEISEKSSEEDQYNEEENISDDDDDLSLVSKSLNFNDEILSNYDEGVQMIIGDSNSLSLIDNITGVFSSEMQDRRSLIKNSDEIGFHSVERVRGSKEHYNREEIGLSSLPPYFDNSSIKENSYPPSGEESGSGYYKANKERLSLFPSLSIFQEAEKENCYRIESDYKDDSHNNSRKALMEIKPSRNFDSFVQDDLNSHIIVPQIVVEQEMIESHRAVNNFAYAIEREVKSGNPKYNFNIHEDDEFEMYFRERSLLLQKKK